MSHVCVAYFPPCPLLALRNAPVPCHYLFKANVFAHVSLSNRNPHVALSILSVEGHYTSFLIPIIPIMSILSIVKAHSKKYYSL